MVLSILTCLSLAGAQPTEDGARRRIEASQRQTIDHLGSVVAQIEGAEKKLGVQVVQRNFLRGVQERLDREQTVLTKYFSSLSSEAAAGIKEKIHSLYVEVGSRSALRTLRNAERRYAQVQDQLSATVRELRSQDVVTRLERALGEAGGVSKMARATLQEIAKRSGDDWSILRWIVPFHFTVELWGGFEYTDRPWYAQVLLTPLAFAGDVVLLPFQILLIGGLLVSSWVS